MTPENGVSIIGAVSGIVVGAVSGGVPDILTGGMYAVIGGAVAVGTYELIARWARL